MSETFRDLLIDQGYDPDTMELLSSDEVEEDSDSGGETFTCESCGCEWVYSDDNCVCPNCGRDYDPNDPSNYDADDDSCPCEPGFDCIYCDNCRALGLHKDYPNCDGKRESAGTDCNDCEYEHTCRDSVENGGEPFDSGSCPNGGPH